MNNKYPYNLPLMDAIRHDYERFRLDTHQYSHKGLFTNGERLIAVILEVKDDQALLAKLEEQYNHFRTAGVPPAIIVDEIPEGFEPIALRNVFEKSNLHGQPMNMNEVINQLNLNIPQKYHPFRFDFKYHTNEFRITFKIELTEGDKEEIQLICEAQGYQGYDYIFEYDPSISDYPGKVVFEPNQFNNLQLPASGFIQKQFSRQLLDRYEEDEDFWLQNRQSVFSGKHFQQRDHFLLPSFEKTNKTRCFVDASVFSRQNLRVYLTLYEQVIIALPLNEDSDHFYQMFKLRTFELRELISRGRLLFVAPQNLARYSQELLLDIISVNPNAIIFSRRLAAITIQGIQNKSGIVGTTFSSDEQYDFVHQCARSGNPGLQRLADMLSEQWQIGEYIVNKEGAVSTYRLGLSGFAISEYKERGRDLTIELATASSSYEFSQGLCAHHFPFDSNSYSEVDACRVIGGLYNGVVKNSHNIRESELTTLLSEVLTINNDMSILELDDVLASSLIRTLPKVISEFANLNDEKRIEEMYRLNKELKQIERNRSRIASLDFIGTGLPAAAGVVMEAANIAGGGYVALGGWILKILSTYSKSSKLLDNPVFLKLSSLNHRVSQDALIVKRVRDSISTIG
jgi:hypothetical protein